MKKLFLLSLVLCVAVCAQDLRSLQTLLEETNATWTAGETMFTNMDPIECEKYFGVPPGIFDISALPEENMEEALPLRGSFTAKHTSIKNQGSCGSCYAFAACATYESFKLIKTGATYDLSEQDFMMKAKAIGPYGGCDGWYLDTSLNLLKNKGVTSESKCAYKGYEAACSSSGSDYKITSWSYKRTPSVDDIKSYLSKYGLVYCAFVVYRDFMNYTGGVYRYTSGSQAGGHAVAIVGYDDAKQAFKVKNSWGTGWGERGYFWIGYDQMNNCVQFGKYCGGSFFITQ